MCQDGDLKRQVYVYPSEHVHCIIAYMYTIILDYTILRNSLVSFTHNNVLIKVKHAHKLHCAAVQCQLSSLSVRYISIGLE